MWWSHASRAIVAIPPIIFLHVNYGNGLAAFGGVHETIFTHIDAGVREGLLLRIEKYQIVRAQLIFLKRIANVAHFHAGSWQLQGQGFQEYMPNKSAAIKTVLGSAASIFIGCFSQTYRINSQIVHCLIGEVPGCRGRDRSITLCCGTRAAQQH